jgi:hypothetical protein
MMMIEENKKITQHSVVVAPGFGCSTGTREDSP